MSTLPLRRARARARPAWTLPAALRRVPPPLAAILAAAALNVFAWSIVTAPLQGPDESAHMGYVQQLAETGHPPSHVSGNGLAVSTEEGTAMVIAGLVPLPTVAPARPSWAAADLREWRRVSARLTAAQRADGKGPSAVGQNPPLYYAYASVPYLAGRALGLDFFGRVMLVRWATALLYLATIVFAWLLVSELFAAPWLRVLATAVIALLPQLAFIGSIVNPDILLIAIWTAFLALTARTLLRGPSARRVLGLGALTAASVLTHGRGLALVPAAVLVVAIAFARHRPPSRAALAGAAGALAILLGGVIAALAATRTSGNGAAYGGVVSATTTGGGSFDVGRFLAYVWQFYLPRLPGMPATVGPQDFGFRQVYIETFFGRFGSLDVNLPRRIYDLLELATALGLAALCVAVGMRWRTLRTRLPLIVALLAAPLSLVALLHLTAYRQLTGGSDDPLLQGRYLLPCVALLGVAVAYLCGALPRRLGAALAGGLLGGGVVISLLGLGLSLARFYA